MNNVQTAINAIRNMNNDEINQVVEAVKLQRTFLARTTARALSVGDEVTFQTRSGYAGGTVVKINRKTVIVDCGLTRYKVPASLLTVKQPA